MRGYMSSWMEICGKNSDRLTEGGCGKEAPLWKFQLDCFFFFPLIFFFPSVFSPVFSLLSSSFIFLHFCPSLFTIFSPSFFLAPPFSIFFSFHISKCMKRSQSSPPPTAGWTLYTHMDSDFQSTRTAVLLQAGRLQLHWCC